MKIVVTTFDEMSGTQVVIEGEVKPEADLGAAVQHLMNAMPGNQKPIGVRIQPPVSEVDAAAMLDNRVEAATDLTADVNMETIPCKCGKKRFCDVTVACEQVKHFTSIEEAEAAVEEMKGSSETPPDVSPKTFSGDFPGCMFTK